MNHTCLCLHRPKLVLIYSSACMHGLFCLMTQQLLTYYYLPQLISGIEFELWWLLWCCAGRTESPPLKRHRTEETSDDTSSHEDEVSDVICGEIARLHHRFVVSVDPSRHPGSKVVSLLCRLGKCVRPTRTLDINAGFLRQFSTPMHDF